MPLRVFSLLILLALAADLAPAQDRGASPEAALDEVLGGARLTPRSVALDEDSPAYEAYEAARAALARDELPLAGREIDAALRADGGISTDVLMLLSQIRYREGRPGEARLATALAGQLNPTDPNVHYALGKLALEQERREDAIRHFAIAAGHTGDPEPSSIAAMVALGEALESDGRPLAAAAAYLRFEKQYWSVEKAVREGEALQAAISAHPDGLLDRALDLLRGADDPSWRVDAVRTALDLRPDDASVQRLYVRTLLDAGQAREAYDYARPRAEQTPAVLSLAIEAASESGQLQGWVSELRAGIDDPDRRGRSRAVAERLDALGRYEESIVLWEALAAAEPADPDITWRLATALRGAGRLPEALERLSAFYGAQGETDARAAFPTDRLERWMEQFSAAREMLASLQSVLDRDADAATLCVYGFAATAADEYDLAERLFAAALAASPESVLARVGQAQLAIERADWQQAKTLATQLIADVPALAHAHWMLGTAHAGLDENEAAANAFREALKASPDDVQVLLSMAALERRTDDLVGAQRFLQEAWSGDPTRGDVLEELVAAYLQGGKLELAREALREARAADVDPASLARAETVVEHAPDLGSDACIAALRSLLDANPSSTQTAILLGVSLMAANRTADAIDVLERVRPGPRDRETVAYLLARAHLREVNPDGAIAVLEPIVQRYPNRRAAIAALSGAYAAAFRMDDARRMYDRLLDLSLEPSQRRDVKAEYLASHVDFMAYDAALERIDAWLAADPNDAELQELRLRVLTAADRGSEAIDYAKARLAPVEAELQALIARYREAEQDDTLNLTLRQSIERDAQSLAERITTLRADLVEAGMRTRQYDALEPVLREWMDDDPGQPQLIEWMVELFLAADKPEEVETILASFRPNDALTLVLHVTWKARAMAAADRSEDAINALLALLKEREVRSNPVFRQQVRRVLSVLLVDAQEFQQAIQLTDEWLLDAGDDVRLKYEILTLRRSILVSAEREEEHIEVAEELLALQPQDPGLNNDLGYSLADGNRDLDRAYEMIRRAVASEPLNSAYLDSLGWVYYKKGDFEKSRVYLERSVALRDGQDPIVYDHLGDAALRLKDEAAARKAWNAGLKMLENRREDEKRPTDAEMLARLRSKLRALDAGERPEIAPTAAEAQEDAGQ